MARDPRKMNRETCPNKNTNNHSDLSYLQDIKNEILFSIYVQYFHTKIIEHNVILHFVKPDWFNSVLRPL